MHHVVSEERSRFACESLYEQCRRRGNFCQKMSDLCKIMLGSRRSIQTALRTGNVCHHMQVSYVVEGGRSCSPKFEQWENHHIEYQVLVFNSTAHMNRWNRSVQFQELRGQYLEDISLIFFGSSLLRGSEPTVLCLSALLQQHVRFVAVLLSFDLVSPRWSLMKSFGHSVIMQVVHTKFWRDLKAESWNFGIQQPLAIL